MARTLDDIRASRPKLDRAKVRATTEADIRRQAAEDDSEPAASLSTFVKRMPGQRGAGQKPSKVQIALRMDHDVLEAWRATGNGWQRRMHDVLKREVQRKTQA